MHGETLKKECDLSSGKQAVRLFVSANKTVSSAA